jgi:hypothetical protein
VVQEGTIHRDDGGCDRPDRSFEGNRVKIQLDAPPDDSGGWTHRTLLPERVTTIRSLIERRLAAIEARDDDALDATYGSWRREQISVARTATGPEADHRTRWYLDTIEHPLRGGVVAVRLSYAGAELQLPHPGVSTWPGAPEYIATLITDRGVDVPWAILYREDADGPDEAFVEVPVFASDPPGFEPPMEVRDPEQVFEEDLRAALWLALKHYAGRMRFDTLRALAVDCVPWHGRVDVYVLTDREFFDEEAEGKWALGSWRSGSLTETPYGTWRGFQDLGEAAQTIYEGAAKPEDAVRSLCARCAAALKSDAVANLLRDSFTLGADFELGVFEPDDPERRNHAS